MIKSILKSYYFILPVFLIFIYLSFQVVIAFEKYKGKALFNNVHNNQRLFAYESYSGRLNQAYYVENAKDTNLLITYYKKLARKDTDAYMTFDISCAMPVDLVVPTNYLYEYRKGSRVALLVNFDKTCWGYIQGYAYLPTLHTTPPPDSLAKVWIEVSARLPTGKNGTPFHHGGGSTSPYGWFCNN